MDQLRSGDAGYLRGRASNFSLVLGGPLYQLLRRARLEDDAGQLVRRRILAFLLITWVPLLVLTAAGGTVWDGQVGVPFLRDVTVHARFLVALPLLVAAELVVHRRLRDVVAQFLERDLVPDDALPRFDAAIEAAMRLRNSVTAELVLIAFVYSVGIGIVWPQFIALATPTWYAPGTGAGLSLAGYWLLAVSLPVFQFLLIRWYFRLFIWARFLWQVSRVPLRILPTHPDGVAGLSFLGGIAYAMAPLAMAHGTLVAGVIADQIFHAGAKLTDFKIELFSLVVFMLCLVVGPLLVFSPQLAAAKRAGNRAYGALAQRHMREFDTKWLQGGAPPGEPLVGSPDISSAADLTNALNVVRTMQLVPFTRQALMQLAVATLLPVAPLLLTMMPLEDLLKLLLGMVV
jgi:hypothetical protein